jgi:hypothetical protein
MRSAAAQIQPIVAARLQADSRPDANRFNEPSVAKWLRRERLTFA